MARKLREDERHFAAQIEEQSRNLGMQRENATHANHAVIIERGGNMQDIVTGLVASSKILLLAAHNACARLQQQLHHVSHAKMNSVVQWRAPFVVLCVRA